jgi:squalene synthase HpnC
VIRQATTATPPPDGGLRFANPPYELSRPTGAFDPLSAPELAPESVLGRAGGENFPVALRWLPRALRGDLLAIYGAARLIDQAGDAARGDRAALLDELERDLRAAFTGDARHPLLRRITPLAAAHGLTPDPFVRLIDANRFDQSTPDLASWGELQDYCRLSAEPVGELVLRVFGQSSDANLRDSGAVCTALQVLEHCQDVAEDARAGRRYLPGDDRARFGCGDSDLFAVPAPESLRRCIALQVERARALLVRGDALCARLRGLARPVVAGYAAGGWATAAALERAGFDPNSRSVRPRPIATLRHALRTAFGKHE